MLSLQDIELGFERYLELLLREERVAREFEQSRGEFFAEPLAARVPNAERRHLEWFLLERPSAELGAVPAQAWQEAWRVSLAGAPAELATSLAQSLAGAFEVTSLAPGEGLWVRDLFTQGEHPIMESRASLSIEVGDLLVGRLFPAGGGAFLLSPAASVFRNPVLLRAVRADLQAMRSARRGVLRVQQLELEHLFHGPGSVPLAPPSPAEALARAEKDLAELGMPRDEVERALALVRRGMRMGDARVLTDILNRLAFDTSVDLAAARLVLAELWDVVETARPPSAGASAPEPREARAALEAFDRGRASGKDLEELFRELERDLGVAEDGELADADDTEEEDAGAPDFPGVVGAMVEEFLWESELEQGPERARFFARLREFGAYAQDIGVFEDLGAARLLDFSARWVLDESRLASAEDAQAMLDALAEFCRWCEERHGVPLWSAFEPTLASLRTSLPRHLVLRQHASPGTGGVSRVVRIQDGRAVLHDLEGNELELEVSDAQAAHLRRADLVRVATRAGKPALGPSYPPELAELLKAK